MRISNLSIVDYVNLIGHYNKIQSGPSIDPRLVERFKDQPERLAQIKEQMDKKGSNKIQSLNVVFKDQIENYMYPEFGYVYTLFKQYSENGVLPFTGPLADQPAQIIQVFNTLDGMELEQKEKAQKEANKKGKRNGKV